MKHFMDCFFCGELHEYKKADGVIAFLCPFLNGVIHFPFYTKDEIEAHKKEAEPKGWKNIFRRGGSP